MLKTITISNKQLSYAVFGSGPPLVFLHGFLESTSMWSGLVNDFTKTNKVLLIDLPGHGKSKEFDEVESMASMAKAVQNVCLTENCDIPIVIGHSMGGYVALELLKLMDCRVALIHSNFWGDSAAKQQDRNRVIKVVESNLNLFVQTAIPNLFALENRLKCQSNINQLISEASQMDANAVIASTMGMRDRADNTNLMSSHEIAILQGDHDSVIPKKQMDIALDKLETKPIYVVLKNCGHMGFLEQPDVFLQALKSIVAKLSPIRVKN